MGHFSGVTHRAEEALFASVHPKWGERGLLAFPGCCRDSGKAPQELPAFAFFNSRKWRASNQECFCLTHLRPI